MSEIKGRTIVITGASRGIGAAAAQAMAGQGASVVLAARTGNEIEAIAREINDGGGRALAVACDVSRFDEVENLVSTTIENFGQIDVLINNAGLIDPISRLDESDPAAWSKVVDVNLKGVYFGARAVLPHMLPRKSGLIINISSGAATGALEGWSHYCATKAAVLSLTRCLHKEYADLGIRTVGLSPGTVATDMQVQIKQSGINPVSQMSFEDHIPAEWVAKALIWLCSDEAREFDGGDFSIKTKEGRDLVGLPWP